MILLVAVAFLVLTTLVTFVQTLYLESLRLLTRELPAHEFFKQDLEKRLGFDTEPGALSFSLLKHITLVLGGGAFVAAAWQPGVPPGEMALEGFGAGFLSLLLGGYVLPQTLYRRTSGRWILPLAKPLRFLALLVSPLAALLRLLGSLFELSAPALQEDKPATASEEIEALINAGEEEGIIEAGDRKLIQNVVEFGDKRVREVMTPAGDIVAISADQTLENLRQLVIHEQYSRIPVMRDSIHHIVGFVHVRDMFEREFNERMAAKVTDIMREIKAVPESKPVSELLREMREEGRQIVLVVNEYGDTAGIATLEDLVEEIFGEIRDEHEPADDLVRGVDGSITVSGSFDLDHLYEHFAFRPAGEIEATTVGGLVTEWLGKVPSPGEKLEREGLKIEVLAANETRVEKVTIKKSA